MRILYSRFLILTVVKICACNDVQISDILSFVSSVAQMGRDARVAALKTLLGRWTADPTLFVQQSYKSDPEGGPVVVDPPQTRILNAVRDFDRVAVRSAHGIGKTTAAAWLTQWWLATRQPALVVTLAGTWPHLEQRLWPEIHTWGRRWLLNEAYEWQEMGIYHRLEPHSWRAQASSSDKPEHIEGWHSPNLLILVDEAKAMPDEMYAAIRGALTTQRSTTGSKPKLVVLSTPPLVNAGWYAELFGIKAEGWTLVHIPAQDSGRVSQDYIEEMARDFGVESAVYQSKVLGNIPDGSSEAVINTTWVEAAQRRPPVKDKKGVVLSCDVAREGEDLTILGRFKNGKFTILRWRATNDTMQCAGMCVAAIKEHSARVIAIDDTGVGGGVTDRLSELRRAGEIDCSIVPVKFGASARRKDRFHSKKDELWWSLRDGLKTQSLSLPSDVELSAHQFPRGTSMRSQLAGAIYEEDSLSRIRVLDKRDGRERTKGLPSKSPDIAHALMIGWESYNFLREVQTDTITSLEALRREQYRQEIDKILKPEEPTLPLRLKNV